MSLDNIVLSPFIVTAFYPKSLVETEGPAAVKEQPAVIQTVHPAISEIPAATLQYLGKNLKNIVILVHYPEQVYLPEEQLNFLTAILKACQLNIGDIAIVNTARQQISLDALQTITGVRQLILFGDMQAFVNHNEQFVIKDINGIAVLGAPELEILNNTSETGKLLKSKLWLCLKQLFNV